MLWRKNWKSTYFPMIGLTLALVLWAMSPVWAAERGALDVELNGPQAADQWVFPPNRGASVSGGELILDTVNRDGVRVFLRQPTLSDLTLTCKVLVESKGPGVRAFEVCFHSAGVASHQFLHVNRASAILGWVSRESLWNKAASVANARKEDAWLDVKVECEKEQVRFYLDGKLVLKAADSHWQAGRIGFGSSQALVRVKDIRVEGTPATLDRPWREDPPKVPKLFGTFHELEPKRRHTKVSGKLDISVSKPFIISSKVGNPQLGAHEQPHLFKMPCGDIHIVFHSDGDIHGATRVVMRSRDKGKSWEPMPISVNRHEAVGVLTDGTVLVYDDYAFRRKGNVFVGQMCVSQDGGRTFGPVELASFHRPNTAGSVAAGTYWQAKDLDKYRTTSAKWSDQLCHALWRSVLQKKDGTLIACAHTHYRSDKKGKARVVCYHSRGGGRTWGSESTVAYDPEVGGEGFVEPVMSLCSNGDVLCMMRHGLWQARSTDGGKTWQPYKTLEVRGVDPDLCLMTDGILACSYGRPGNRIMFSVDGTGREWTDRVQIYEYQRGSFGYTGIAEVEPGKLLYVYDRRDSLHDGHPTPAVQGVYITVKRKG
ncbi:MAG: exo-alpha-sialidase [Pirellulaceae bacterium]|jgi:hypothetical protein|nr:exo-alpha-sialidase [Pirellulaceae bacterium]HJN11352.1 sialidase family protein [Pirellulaceae bacterium]